MIGTANAGSGSTPEPTISPPFEQLLKIDVHAHLFDDMPEFVEMARRVNLRVLNVCFCGSKPEWLESAEKQAELIFQKYNPTFYFASTFDLTRRNEPGYAQNVIDWLDKTFEAGALFTKIWKEVGMELRAPSGAYLLPDDDLFDPIYDHLARRGKPLMAHFADPIDAWRPLDPTSAHYSYFANNPKWHMYNREGAPGHEEIISACDRVLVKHPELVVIAAHLGSMEHDLAALAKRLDCHSNLYVDVSGRTYTLFQQPRELVREFFMTYQDRVLYGVDAGDFRPGESLNREERIALTNGLEKTYRIEYQFYAGCGGLNLGGSEVECLSLPREVIEMFYHRNAQRLFPDMEE